MHLFSSAVSLFPRLPGKKAEVMFTMSEGQVKREVPGQPSVVGKDHQFLLTGVGNQNLMVYSRQQTGETDGYQLSCNCLSLVRKSVFGVVAKVRQENRLYSYLKWM